MWAGPSRRKLKVGQKMENDVRAAANEVYASILCEFLEVAIHLILYVREIYPPGLFQRMRKYSVPVHICGHPDLNQYIRHVVDGIKPRLEAGQVDHLAVIIRSKENLPVESFIFQTQKGQSNDICSQSFFDELARDLRTLLLKIGISDSLLTPNPPDCTFTIEVGVSENGVTAMEQGHQDFPWMVEDNVSGERAEFHDSSAWTLIPLKSLSNDLLKVTLLAKECRSRKINSTSSIAKS